MPYTYLELSLSGSLMAPKQGSLTMTGEFLNISTLDPLLPTFLIATLYLCVLSVITYYSLAIAWEVFWASQQSPLLLDPSTEVVLTFFLSPVVHQHPTRITTSCTALGDPYPPTITLLPPCWSHIQFRPWISGLVPQWWRCWSPFYQPILPLCLQRWMGTHRISLTFWVVNETH